MKTFEQIAEDLWQHVQAGNLLPYDDIQFDQFAPIVTAAIKADRAQREAQLTHLVIAEHGKNQPEAIIGMCPTEFEANAVAREWNRVNRQHGITYRVEDDA